MKKLLLLCIIFSPILVIGQDTLRMKFSLAQRTGSFAPRILKQLGTNAYTAEFMATAEYKEYFFTVLTTKDLNQFAGLGPENLAGNSVLLMTGKNFNFGKLFFTPRLGLFQLLENNYFEPKRDHATLIPNIFLRYKISKKLFCWIVVKLFF
jgi:hypothetical protein